MKIILERVPSGSEAGNGQVQKQFIAQQWHDYSMFEQLATSMFKFVWSNSPKFITIDLNF